MTIIDFLCKTFCCEEKLKLNLVKCEVDRTVFKKEMDNLVIEQNKTKRSLDNSIEGWKMCRDKKDELTGQVTTLTKKLKDLAIPQEDPREAYWNSKYPKKTIVYKRTEKDGNYSIDVRNYFQINDFNLLKIVEDNKLNVGTFDERALKCLNWVKANITYISDKTEYGISEFWCYAYQTLKHKKGDCEDGSIVLANLMIIAKIPYWRVRINAGNVSGGGHAYTTYCRETDEQFVVLDWCYWYKSIPVSERKLHSEEADYYGIWFSWNQKYSFGAMETMSGMEGFKRVK